MLKHLKIDPYIDGYNWKQMNCTEIAIAGASGFYNFDNYYFFSFYFSYMINWIDIEWQDIKSPYWIDIHNNILKKLGLAIKAHKVNSSSELIEFIKNSIDNSIPILLIADYTSLFYTYHYLNDVPYSHGTIISGYHTEKPIIVFRETTTVDFNIEKEASERLKGSPLFNMFLKEDHVIDIWESKNKFYEKVDSRQVNTIYTIEKTGNTEIESYEDVIIDAVKNFNYKNDNLIKIINNFDIISKDLKNESIPIWYLLRDYRDNLDALFYVLEIAIKNSGFIDSFDTFNKFKEELKNLRGKVLTILNTLSLRGKGIDEAKKDNLITDIKDKNKELEDFILKCYKIIMQNYTPKQFKIRLIDYAKESIICADSEFISGAICHKASNVVNGNWNSWQNDAWVSDDLEVVHWLKFDLLKKREINKFVIRHYGGENYNTVDYNILGSNDDINWDQIISVKENKQDITSHEVKSCIYRYIKLNITNPGAFDCRARIYEFEAWGQED